MAGVELYHSICYGYIFADLCMVGLCLDDGLFKSLTYMVDIDTVNMWLVWLLTV